MRHLILTLTALTLLGAPARAEPDAIAQVIQGQIAAFQADDFETAFAFASPAIKGLFGSADRFGAMVQQGYPMVHRPADVRLLDTRPDAGSIVQRVLIRDAGGRLHLLDYYMIDTDQGWQINGVHILRAPEAGV